ncbi:MAG: lactate utilization protein C [Balneolaceae bacterium]
MSSSKEEILNKVRAALKDVPDEESTDQPVDRSYRRQSSLARGELVNMFAEHVGEYQAWVKIIKSSELAKTIGESCERESVKKLVVPAGINENWLPSGRSGLTILKDEPKPLSHDELDQSDAVLTGCHVAVAQTGTVVLNGGPGQGRRVLTLLPDFHICVVRAEQIVEIIPEAFSELDQLVRESGPPVTFISGPSATSDIELSRVEGVHGPRRLEVLILEG